MSSPALQPSMSFPGLPESNIQCQFFSWYRGLYEQITTRLRMRRNLTTRFSKNRAAKPVTVDVLTAASSTKVYHVSTKSPNGYWGWVSASLSMWTTTKLHTQMIIRTLTYVSIKSNHLKTSPNSTGDQQKTKTSYCSSRSSPYLHEQALLHSTIHLTPAFAQQLGNCVSTEHLILVPQDPQASANSNQLQDPKTSPFCFLQFKTLLNYI